LTEFIGFVPSLTNSANITEQDKQNFSTNVLHIISQQLQYDSKVDKKSLLIDCVDVTVKIQQYIRDIMILCRNHPLVKQYPTPETTKLIVIASK